MRTLVIGDIHGGLKALEQVLIRAAVTTEDRLIFLGDYTDGWADSFELIEFLIELDKSHNCIFLQGNHDVWCRDWLTTGMIPTMGPETTWKERGGISTIESYNDRRPVDLEPHRAFFRRLHFYYEDLDNKRLFVHAGYTQGGGARFENPYRNLWWDRNLWEKAYAHEQKFNKNGNKHVLYNEYYPTILKAYNEIFIGHTSCQLYGTIQPIKACNVTNVDTGCGHRHGVLTMMNVDTREYWQSDRLTELYPEDMHNEFMGNQGAELV